MVNKDWEYLMQIRGEKAYEWFSNSYPDLYFAMTKTKQDPIHHQEGDVWTHTKMVCQHIIKTEEYINASDEDQFVLFYSALFHDIGKPACTKEEDGEITSKGHSLRGANEARVLLWELETPFSLRESIVSIIESHQIPFYLIEKENAECELFKLSYKLPIHLLLQVAKSDIQGRICQDQQSVLDRIELMREYAIQEDCLFQPKKLPDVVTRHEYFQRNGLISKDYLFYKKTGSSVIVLCGLPATGKNYWIEHNNLEGLPVLSFDDMKEELGIRQGSNDGEASRLVKEKAKEYLRKEEPFIWNATHLSKKMRDKTLSLLRQYNAEIRIVYIESSKKEIATRNEKRDSSISNSKIWDMLYRWTIPNLTECHFLDININTKANKIKRSLR